MARSTLPAARPDVAEAAITGGVDTHRRTKEGKQTKFIMRCLKRHVAREIFKLLPRDYTPLTT